MSELDLRVIPKKIRWNFSPELREHMKLSAELEQQVDDFFWKRARAEFDALDRRIMDKPREA